MMLIRRARSWFGALCALAILAVPAILVGCSFESGGFIVTLPAHVRFFNVMKAATNVSKPFSGHIRAK